jgi:DNA-binding Lrp family transcriptional regulator
VLIQTQPGIARLVADEIAAVPGISSAVVVTGPYDVIAGIEADNIDALGRVVLSRIQAVQGVTRTLTCPVVHI